jgi:hypothetical protein
MQLNTKEIKKYKLNELKKGSIICKIYAINEPFILTNFEKNKSNHIIYGIVNLITGEFSYIEDTSRWIYLSNATINLGIELD